MIRTLGWISAFVICFCLVGFFFDWVDIKKNKDEDRIEFMLNSGKIANSISQGFDNVVGWFE